LGLRAGQIGPRGAVELYNARRLIESKQTVNCFLRERLQCRMQLGFSLVACDGWGHVINMADLKGGCVNLTAAENGDGYV
jgi:hypothetical protein